MVVGGRGKAGLTVHRPVDQVVKLDGECVTTLRPMEAGMNVKEIMLRV